jgi:hypothetical protein
LEVWDGSGWGERDGNETHLDFGAGREDRKDKERIRGAKWGTNGVVVGIEGVLDTPPSIGESLKGCPWLD